MDFQKQLDTVTGALNIFDMSYLVSGATMLGVLVYAFPDLKGFVFHKDQVTVSIIVCIIIAYVLGIISWIAGKQFRYWMMEVLNLKRAAKIVLIGVCFGLILLFLKIIFRIDDAAFMHGYMLKLIQA